MAIAVGFSGRHRLCLASRRRFSNECRFARLPQTALLRTAASAVNRTRPAALVQVQAEVGELEERPLLPYHFRCLVGCYFFFFFFQASSSGILKRKNRG